MRLADYLTARAIPAMEFGRRLGLKQPNSVYRYLRHERLPSPEVMQAIARATNGEVTANDFYGIVVGREQGAD